MISARRRAIKILGGAGAVLVAGGSAVWAWLRWGPAAGPVIDLDPHTPLDYPFPEAAVHTAPLPLTSSCGDQHLTDSDIEGPYYTPHTPQRTNLRASDTIGIPLTISGRVVRQDCVPLAGAVLDFWCCDGRGIYDNEGYNLRGHQFTDDHGAYIVELVKPGDYRDAGIHRTPHVHVKVQGRDTPLLTTQLFFPGEPLNAQDEFFKMSLFMSIQQTERELTGHFDFVLGPESGAA